MKANRNPVILWEDPVKHELETDMKWNPETRFEIESDESKRDADQIGINIEDHEDWHVKEEA